ncbi:MAG TPA: Xaa-Pro peptidase family protein [Candidatus Hydrogenedentes bacterium]|nr:Xaa-Pro peptidase family protein [Candidatus Hydrogenedentota bacterium]
MKQRISKLRDRLAAAGGDAFFSLSPPANQYLSGFRGSTSAIAITHTESVFLCDFRYTEQARIQVEGWAVEEVSGSLPTRLAERLAGLGARTAVYDPQGLTVAQLSEIQQAYDGTLKPDADIVAALRQIKEPGEIEAIREASALAEGVLADLMCELRAGTTEREFAARFEYEFKRRGASGAAFDTIVLFGPRTSLPHGAPDDTPLKAGDAVLLDFGCRLNGYCSDLTRTYAFGTIPQPWFEGAYELVLTAQRIALEAARPGISARELDATARDLIEEAGQGKHFGHGLGHGVGIEVHEAPRMNRESETILEPGMVITIVPGVYLPGQGGIRIEDLVAVTQGGCNVLSETPKELRVIQT